MIDDRLLGLVFLYCSGLLSHALHRIGPKLNLKVVIHFGARALISSCNTTDFAVQTQTSRGQLSRSQLQDLMRATIALMQDSVFLRGLLYISL